MTIHSLFVGCPTNTRSRDVRMHVKALVGVEHLLDLGAKYCV